MKKFFVLVLSLLMMTSFVMDQAYAKRFGGGASFGKNHSAFRQANTPKNAPIKNAAPTQANQASSSKSKSWLAGLMGFAAGGILASLLMGHGLGNLLLIALAVGLVVFLLAKFIRHRSVANMNAHAQPATEGAYTSQNQVFYGATGAESVNTSSAKETTSQNIYDIAAYRQRSGLTPNDFNEDNFLRFAKAQFIRLQAANDDGNLQDLRNFTTPEVFAEIRLQLQERGDASSQTNVESVKAELLDVNNEGQALIATVQFSGVISEDNAPAQAFNEIWLFQQDGKGSWLVAGVQQN